MAVTPSNMLPLGTPAPHFILPDTITHRMLSLEELKSDSATVILFICNHCPYVIHIQKKLVEVATEYQQKNIRFIAINSNDIQKYPDDSPDNMQRVAKKCGYPFPYLFDETQAVAKAYQAACTPDFYVFDNELKCVYRGRFDESRPGSDAPVTGHELRQALDSILNNQPISIEQKPSVGCNIKWKV